MKALDHAVKHCAWYMKIDQYHEGIHGDDECEMDPNRTYSRQEIKFSVGYEEIIKIITNFETLHILKVGHSEVICRS